MIFCQLPYVILLVLCKNVLYIPDLSCKCKGGKCYTSWFPQTFTPEKTEREEAVEVLLLKKQI